MDLNRLKIEHSNAITAKLAEKMKSDENMMKHFAVAFMDRGDSDDKISYLKSKASCAAINMAIDIVQTTSRSFEFEGEAK